MGMLESIRSGKYDAHLDRIITAIRDRKQMIASERFYELRVGEKVRFVRNIRPTYLAGVQATVVGKKVKKIIVKPSSPVGRFRGDITVPASLVERVEEGEG